MAEFPWDLTSQILRLLPVSTLLRFKCVSKTFFSIIDDHNFIKLHLNTNSEHKTHREIVFQNYPDLVPVHAAHCNGLVLTVTSNMSRFGVCNPSTRKYWTIPYQRGGWVLKSCSFGYEPSTDDYKVLLVNEVNACPHCDCWDDTRPEFWILGLRSGSWKRIERNYPHPYFDDLDAGVLCFVDGAFYFTTKARYYIYAIDVLEEMFFPVSFPDDIEQTDFLVSLQVFEGCLCVRFRCLKDDSCDGKKDGTEKLYLRKKNDKGEFFWTKLLTFAREDNGLNIMSNLGRDRRFGHLNGRDKMFILYSGHECELYFYDYEEKSTERIVKSYMKYGAKVIFCVESLVSLDYLLRKEEGDEESKLDNV